MKKIIVSILSLLCLVFLVSCGTKESTRKETKVDDALIYNFNVDDDEYRFRLLDGWIKYPNKDESILFLVGNKDIKSFMTAGFEPKETSLEEYKTSFVTKLEESGGSIINQSEKRKMNDLDCYSIEFTLKDAKNRILTYKTNLVETKEYFFNVAAWTSQEKPDEKTKEQFTKMLDSFEEVK